MRQKEGRTYNKEECENNPEKYESIFHSEIMPKLSMFVNAISWKSGSNKLITT